MAKLIILGLQFCAIVGPIQLIGSIIRRIRLTDNTTHYARGLVRYHQLVGLYCLLFILAIPIKNTFLNIKDYTFLVLPGAAISLALYYWVVIFYYPHKE